jgi:hypothetical protein
MTVQSLNRGSRSREASARSPEREPKRAGGFGLRSGRATRRKKGLRARGGERGQHSERGISEREPKGAPAFLD